MKKLLLLFTLFLSILLNGCNKKDDTLRCEKYNGLDNNCLVFLYKDDCKYCEKDFYYVNQYNSETSDTKLFSYKLEKDEVSFRGVEIKGVPTLVLIENGEIKIVATGYIQVRRYLNK